MNPPPPDLAQCADEPMRVPGAIQPHGRMAVQTPQGRLLAFSANWESEQAVCDALRLLPVDSNLLRPGTGPTWIGTLPLQDRTFDAAAHRQGDCIVVEYEPGGPASGLHAPIYGVARDLLPLLEQATSIDALCQTVVREMKRLTGFGRCLAYRFDEEGHGEVLAERIDAGYHSYDGHRFPAGDVPAQARELYRANHIHLCPRASP